MAGQQAASHVRRVTRRPLSCDWSDSIALADDCGREKNRLNGLHHGVEGITDDDDHVMKPRARRPASQASRTEIFAETRRRAHACRTNGRWSQY